MARFPAFLASCALLFLTDARAQTMNDRHSITVYSRAQPGAVNPAQISAESNPMFRRQRVPGYAIVRTRRTMDLSSGEVNFTDVAAGIDPTTVAFKSLTAPDTRVLEQNYRYDLVSTERMLERFLGQQLTVRQVLGKEVETVTGTLMTADGTSAVLAQEDGQLVSVSRLDQVAFPDLPDGLITRPTLNWAVATDRDGEHEIEVSYETEGMTWWADYNLLVDESDGCRADLSAWVSLINQTGASFASARLKLIAGDVNRAPQTQVQAGAVRRRAMDAAVMAETSFEEEAFFEYHLYTLSRPANLPDRSLKQLELFPAARGVECEKQLIFSAGYRPGSVYGRPYTNNNHPLPLRGDVQVRMKFRNSEDNALGIPLPAGRIRVSQRNASDGDLEFIGEDVVDHTPRNEAVSVKLGNAFDVVAERRQAAFQWNSGDSWMEETIEIELRNQKEESARVQVRESMLRWTNWRLTRQSHEEQQLDAGTIEFVVDVAPESAETISYTVRYEW
ncbi:MAG: DUF4139 domain-containing protein [Pseudomonadota bacterium]